jgi:alanine racemase
VTAAVDPAVAPAAMPSRWAWAEIDLGAVAHNVGVVARTVTPAAVWAVVKADAYGHGAVPVARAAVAAGAAGLGVALTSEGIALRTAGIDAPIIVLSEQPPGDAAALVAHGLTPTVTTPAGIDALAAVRQPGVAVHLKLDTGMHRIGARPEDAPALAARVRAHSPWLHLAGVYTHLAVADEPADPYTGEQLRRFDVALAELADPPAMIHAANSAGALAHPAARRSLVRAGIVVYGIIPGPGVADRCADLRPVLALKARVSFVQRRQAGDRISYGLRHTFARPATVATVPIGYHDGVRRGLFPGQTVLHGGRRRPIVGSITMDQLMIDCGDDPVAVGDEVVLLGHQGAEVVRAEEWADRLGTIGYEITCGINPRVPRVYLPAPAPARLS